MATLAERRKVLRLKKRRGRALDEAEALRDESGAVPAEHREKFNELVDEAGELREEMEKLAEADGPAMGERAFAGGGPFVHTRGSDMSRFSNSSNHEYVAFDDTGDEVRSFGPGESIYERRKAEQGWSDDWDEVTLGDFLVARDVTGPRTEAEERAITAPNVGLPQPIESQFIDTLREQSLAGRLNIRSFPMESKTLRVVRVDSDVGGDWLDEASTFSSTDPSLGTVELKARTRRGKLEIGRETFDDGVGLEEGINRSLVSMLVRGLNDAILKGNAGSTTVPTGISQASTITVTNFGGSTSGATVSSSAAQWGEVLRARQALLDREVNPANLQAVTSPKAMRLFASLKDANHQPLARPDLLRDLEIMESVSSPTTISSTNGNAGMEMDIGDFSGMALGVRLDPEVRVVDASLADNWSLTLVGAARWDVAFPRPEAIERLIKIST